MNIQEILTRKPKYILAKNNNPETFFFTYEGYDDREEYINVLNKGGSNFEYIGVDSIVKPYIDYEKVVATNTKNKEEGKKKLLDRLLHIFVSCCNVNFNMCLDIDDVVILDGSRQETIKGEPKYKYSFHITTKNNKYVFKNQTEAKIIKFLMKETEKQIYSTIEICTDNDVDGSVYGKTQRLRTIYGSKYNNKGLIGLQPITRNGEKFVPNNPLVYLVKYYEDDCVYIDLTKINENKELNELNEHSENSSAIIYSKKRIENANIHNTYNMTENKEKQIITDYRKDINDLLIKKGIKQPLYISHSEYKENIIYKYCYEKGGECIYGEHHDRNNRNNATLYIYVKEAVVWCGCYGGSCKSKKNIKLGVLLEKSPLENPINAIQCDEPKLTLNKNNEVNKVFNQFISDDTKKALCIKSRCGTGKTHAMYEYIHKYLKKQPDARILMISTRQSYARAMCNDDKSETKQMETLNIINYLEYKENNFDMDEIYKLPRLCISLESLKYIIKAWIPYDIVILDESESICRHLFSDTVDVGSVGIYFHLQKIINIDKCKKIFLLDADLSNPTLTLINGIKKENILMLNNTYNNNTRNYYITQDADDWMTNVKSKIILNKKVFIVCLSVEAASHLYDELKKTNIMANIMNGVEQKHNDHMFIMGDMDDATKKQMGNVNELWKNKGLVITTSATGAGVDFSIKNHFDYIYGSIYSGLSPPIEFLQICHRVRHPNNNNIYVLCNSKMRLPDITYNISNNKITNTRSFIYTVKNARDYINVVKKTVITSPKLKSIWNNEKGCMTECSEEWDLNYSKLQYYEYVNRYLNNQPCNYLLVLKLLIEQHGDKVIVDPIKMKQKRIIKDNTNILNETKIADKDRNELRLQQEKKLEDRKVLEKNKMRIKFRIDNKYIDDDLKEVCDVYMKKLNIYENTKYIHMYEDTKLKESIKHSTNKLYDTINNKIKQSHMNIYTRFMEHSKYDYTDGFKIDVKDFETIYNNLQITNIELKSTSRMGEEMTNNKVILTVLRNYGLELKTHRLRRVVDGERVSITSHYTIEQQKEIYNCLYMELYGLSGYNVPFMNMVNRHNKYEGILTINNKKEHKKLF